MELRNRFQGHPKPTGMIHFEQPTWSSYVKMVARRNRGFVKLKFFRFLFDLLEFFFYAQLFDLFALKKLLVLPILGYFIVSWQEKLILFTRSQGVMKNVRWLIWIQFILAVMIAWSFFGEEVLYESPWSWIFLGKIMSIAFQTFVLQYSLPFIASRRIFVGKTFWPLILISTVTITGLIYMKFTDWPWLFYLLYPLVLLGRNLPEILYGYRIMRLGKFVFYRQLIKNWEMRSKQNDFSSWFPVLGTGMSLLAFVQYWRQSSVMDLFTLLGLYFVIRLSLRPLKSLHLDILKWYRREQLITCRQWIDKSVILLSLSLTVALVSFFFHIKYFPERNLLFISGVTLVLGEVAFLFWSLSSVKRKARSSLLQIFFSALVCLKPNETTYYCFLAAELIVAFYRMLNWHESLEKVSLILEDFASPWRILLNPTSSLGPLKKWLENHQTDGLLWDKGFLFIRSEKTLPEFFTTFPLSIRGIDHYQKDIILHPCQNSAPLAFWDGSKAKLKGSLTLELQKRIESHLYMWNKTVFWKDKVHFCLEIERKVIFLAPYKDSWGIFQIDSPLWHEWRGQFK